MSFWSRIIDERFLAHRQRSTAVGGIAGAVVALGLFAWHYYVDHVWNWELLAVGIAVVVVKLTVLAWSALRN